MKPTQSDVQKRVIWGMIIGIIVLMCVFPDFGNLVLSLSFALIIVVFPFSFDSITRLKIIPFMDSINETKTSRYTQDFPLWLKVVIWIFACIFVSVLWTAIVPLIFRLPLWIGSIAIHEFHWEPFRFWGHWQYGWMIAFLLQYFVGGFLGSWAFLHEFDSFEERFDYP